jgi:hypothetical protein
MAEPWKNYQPISDDGPWKKYEDPSLWKRVRAAVTGEDRETETTKSLPEFDLPFEFSARQAKTALGLLTTFDPKDQINILKENYPDLKFAQDEKGNILVDGAAYGGGQGALNIPGVSLRDLTQAGFQVGSFMPGANFVRAVTVPGRAAQAAALSGGTQAALDIASQAAGRDAEISPSNIRGGDVAIATAFGGLGQGTFDLFAKALSRLGARPSITTTVQTVDEITPDIRKAAQEAYKQFGGNIDNLSDDAILAALNSQGLSDDLARSMAAGMTPDEAAIAANQAAQEGTERFGIELSRGQRTGSPTQLQFEEAVRAGALGGDKAQGQAIAQQARQRAQTVQAAQNVQESLGGGQRSVSSVNEAADAAIDAVATKAEDFYGQVREAYQSAPNGAALNTEGAQSLFNGMAKALRGAEVAKDLPQTSAVLGDIRSMQKTLKIMSANNARIPIRQLETFRQRLNTRIGAATGSDQVQVMAVKRAFDEYLDGAIAKGLVHGGEDAGKTLSALKHARSLRKGYGDLFEPKPSRTRAGVIDNDPGGRILNKMAELEPTTEEVVSALYGSGRVFGKRGSAQLAERLKTVLGPESAEWRAIREAGLLRLMGVESGQIGDGVRISGREFLKRIHEAKAGRGQSLANALYTPEEIGLMENLAKQIIRSQPTPANPSGTAGQLGFQMRELVGRLGQMMGFASGDPTMTVLATFAQRGGQGLKDRKVIAVAEQAFSGKPLQIIKANPDLVGASIGGASITESRTGQ